MTPSGKKRYDRKIAIKVAAEITNWLAGSCERIVVAGSLRRRKLQVVDVEIVYIPTFKEEQVDLVTMAPVNQADKCLENLIKIKVIAKRKNVLGSEVWGEKNKLAVHCKSGIPVDFFSTRLECWYSYLVCRTGGSRNNILIAEAAKRKGWTWNPYSVGFTTKEGEIIPVKSEAEVFEFVGLKYLHPHERP